MTRIAIDARILDSTTGRIAKGLLDELQRQDSETEYIVLLRAADTDKWVPTAPNFSVAVADFAPYSWREQLSMSRLLRSLNVDLVHFLMPQQPLLYRGARVTTFLDFTLLGGFDPNSRGLRFRAKQVAGLFAFFVAARRSKRVLVCSEYTGREVTRRLGVPADRIDLVYFAGESPEGRFGDWMAPFDDYLLYVGAQLDFKNVPALAEAHQRLLPEHPDLGLVLVGRLDDRARVNRSAFERAGYRGVSFTGYVDDDVLATIYSKSTAYVLPSLSEGFGLPGLEAMAAGAPVISSDRTCLPEIFGDAAEYFDPTNVTAMAATIDRVISDPARLRDLAVRGQARAAQFTWRETAIRTRAVYAKALGQGG